MQRLRHLVVGTDFSAAAEAALETAVTLGRLSAAGITLVHVCDQHGEGDEDVAESCRTQLAACVARWTDRGVPIAALLRSGRPPDKLHNVAAEVGASLIVLGRSGAAELGSTTERVLRTARRPVLVVAGWAP